MSLSRHEFDAVVREIAQRSAVPVLRRLRANTAAMSIAELRGYVAARALAPIRIQAQQVVAERRLPPHTLDEFVERSLERTIHAIVRERVVQPISALPTAHVPLRAAA